MSIDGRIAPSSAAADQTTKDDHSSSSGSSSSSTGGGTAAELTTSVSAFARRTSSVRAANQMRNGVFVSVAAENSGQLVAAAVRIGQPVDGHVVVDAVAQCELER